MEGIEKIHSKDIKMEQNTTIINSTLNKEISKHIDEMKNETQVLENDTQVLENLIKNQSSDKFDAPIISKTD